MIFPDVPLQDWLQKFPELDIIERNCEGCGSVMKAIKPFVMSGYAGLISEDCPCNGNQGLCSSRITTSLKEHVKWTQICDAKEES